ncbi:MAG: hypothetical protein ACYS9X_08610, partial [Planctomycetota bacterium]
PGRSLSHRQQQLLNLAVGERTDRLRLLLKLDRDEGASALAKEILALRPERIDADPDAVKAALLARVATAYSSAYDPNRRETHRHRLEADSLHLDERRTRRALIERHVWCAVTRRRAMRALKDKERLRLMLRIWELGTNRDFERLLRQAMAGAVEEQRERRARGEEGSQALMSLATALAEVPSRDLKPGDFDWVEKVLDAVEPADSHGARMLRGVVRVRRGDARGAVEVFDALLADARKDRERALNRERWLGTGGMWLRYREPEDVFEHMPLTRLLLMASAYRRAGRAETAERLIEKAERQDPKRKNWFWSELKERAR